MTGAEFKQARQSLGLTQSQAAHVFGYGAQSRISEVEGAATVPPQTARLMAAYLAGYRPDDWPLDK